VNVRHQLVGVLSVMVLSLLLALELLGLGAAMAVVISWFRLGTLC
jgi:hypothetical protein